VLPTKQLYQCCLQPDLFLFLVLLLLACSDGEERENKFFWVVIFSLRINRGSMQMVEHQIIYSPERKEKMVT
jgi:hypothetical protein